MPNRRPTTRAVACFLLLVLALLGAACRTDVDVLIKVKPGGAGTVTVTADLDAAAAAAVGDPSNLSFTDLTAAGWKLTNPAAHAGGLRVVAVRTFASADQLPAVLDEVGGTNGVFSATSLSLTDGFASSSTAFRTKLRLSGDLGQFSDDQLTELLGGLALARTPEDLAASGADAADAATLTVRVVLPGGVDGGNGKLVKGVSSWSAPLSGGTATDQQLVATGTEQRTGSLVLLGVGAALVVAAIVLVVVGLVRRGD